MKHWQKNFGFDKNGRMEDISYTLENDALLQLSLGDKQYTIDFAQNIVPQIDKIFE